MGSPPLPRIGLRSMIRWNYTASEFLIVADSASGAIYDTVKGLGTGYNQLQQQNAYYAGQPSCSALPHEATATSAMQKINTNPFTSHHFGNTVWNE